MSKIVIIVTLIFWLAFGFFYFNSRQPNSPSANINAADLSSNLGTQLAQHKTSTDCWLLIAGKIYDLTSYIQQHPGGAQEIIKFCGQDATEAYNTKDNKSRPRPHSAGATALLDKYFIGLAVANTSSASNDINNNTNTNTANTNINSNTPVPTVLSLALVAQHNQASDCWVTVGTSVYNVTSYISSHPGGRSAITAYCGADIGPAFEAQGHSNNARNILASYKIGTVGSPAAPASNNLPGVSNPVGTPDGEAEDDD